MALTIDVFSDPVCPWCYIGLRRLERALGQLEVTPTVGWRAFQLNPQMPPEGMTRAAYLEAKFGARAPDMYERVKAVGAAEGIGFAFDRIQRQPSTLDAHRLIRRVGGAVVLPVFRAFFEEGRDIGDRAVLAEIAAAAGADAGFLDGDAEREEVLGEDQWARSVGIDGVPCFIINGRQAVMGAQDPASLLAVFRQAA